MSNPFQHHELFATELFESPIIVHDVTESSWLYSPTLDSDQLGGEHDMTKNPSPPHSSPQGDEEDVQAKRTRSRLAQRKYRQSSIALCPLQRRATDFVSML
jgi:hypothetical protein